MKKLSRKRVRLLITLAIILGAIALIGVPVVANVHHIYVWTQAEGLFLSPIDVQKTTVENTARYTIDELESDPRVTLDQSMMLVNKQTFLPEGFEPDVVEYKDTGVYMSACMTEAYAALSGAVSEKTGNKLYVSSDFRSAEEQEALYIDDPATATLPGASEHQTGLALDVYVAYYAGDAFIKSESGRFVNSECWRYGFIIRYPSYAEDITGIRYEPWHIRYVGHPHADVIYNNHTTLEEYVTSLELDTWYMIDGYLVSRQSYNGSLELPETLESCVISPDNMGNYVVTVMP